MKKFWTRRRFIIPVALLMASVIATVAAATLLFTHSFPSVVIPGQPALVNSVCGTMVASVPTTASGTVIFGCPPPVGVNVIQPAFKTGSTGVAVAATGGIPSTYTDLYAIPASAVPATTCAATAGSVLLLGMNPGPATPLTLTVSSGAGLLANTPYGYCADYNNPTATSITVSTFSVNWQQ